MLTYLSIRWNVYKDKENVPLNRLTSAPNSVRVSMRTAVWTVICKQPAIRAPFKILPGPYFLRMAINPGISFSAMMISLRPVSAKLMSAIGKR